MKLLQIIAFWVTVSLVCSPCEAWFPVLVPVGQAVLAVAGFTAAGPAAGSFAASMMSAAAVAGGGGVVSGGSVALLQSAAMGGAPAIASAIGAATLGTGAAVVGTACSYGSRESKE